MVFGSVAKDGVRFLLFDGFKNNFKNPETGAMTPPQNMLAGIYAGVVSSTLASTPTERLKIVLIDDVEVSGVFARQLMLCVLFSVNVVFWASIVATWKPQCDSPLPRRFEWVPTTFGRILKQKTKSNKAP